MESTQHPQVKIQNVALSDKDWVKSVFNINKGILGSFDLVWYRYQHSANPKEFWLVLQPQIGFCHYRIRKDGTKVIDEIAIADAHKCKGYGKVLMKHIGLPIELKTDADNIESNEFYRKAGFMLMGRKTSKSGEKLFNVWRKF